MSKWPYPVLSIDRAELVRCIKAAVGKVRYRLGAKPGLDAVPGQAGFKVSDCSGFVRWMMHQLGYQWPDGSYYQQEYCKAAGFKPTSYDMAGLRDDRLRIAFINPAPGKPGHVWLVINGSTIECCSGQGITRRPWDHKTLKTEVDACYVLTDPLS